MSEDFPAHIMEQVALRVLPEFLGPPNEALSSKTEKRFGSKGSVSVDLVSGTYFDHEDQVGGGVMHLLRAYKGFTPAQSVEWLTEQGLLEKREQANGHAPGEKFAGFMDHHPIATYQYQDADGRLAYEILKFSKDAPRRFMQRRPHPQGGWIWGLRAGLYGKTKGGDWFRAKSGKKYDAEQHFDEAPWFLYRRDEVLRAIADGRPLLIAEGEKDCETLRTWGLTATTNQGGAQNWKPSLTADLAGADVILLPDNDDAGRQRITILGAELRGVAQRVRVLDLAQHWQDAPAKADVTDWKEQAGGTAARFLELAAAAPLWQPLPPKSRFGGYGFSLVGKRLGPRYEFIVDEWVPARGRGVIAGPSQSGKSFLAIHLAMCVARGVDFFGWKVTKGGVIYQAGEGGIGIDKRFQAYKKHFKVPDEEEVPLVILPQKVDLFSPDGDVNALIEEIKAWSLTMAEPLRLVVVDTLATATVGADENSVKDMGIALKNIARVEEALGCHVMLVHHMSADGKKLRGSTSIHANIDTVITVFITDATDRVRKARLVKQKDGEDGIDLVFTLGSVELGEEDWTGKPKTSCVVLTVSEKEQLRLMKERSGFSVKPAQAALLTPLFKALKRYGRFVASEDDGPPEAIGKIVVDYSYFIDVAYEMNASEGTIEQVKNRLRESFKRNITEGDLARYNVIAFRRVNGGKTGIVWWTGKPIRGFPETFPDYHRNPPEDHQEAATNPQVPMSPGMAEMLEGQEQLPW